MANLSVRLMMRTRVAGMLFFVACVVVYYYVKLGSCLSYVSAALGLLPMHFVMTALIIVMLYLFMPKDPDAQDQVLQVCSLPSRLLRKCSRCPRFDLLCTHCCTKADGLRGCAFAVLQA